ncbi:MAG: hypothetical protein HRF49_11500, partial [bacterium]
MPSDGKIAVEYCAPEGHRGYVRRRRAGPRKLEAGAYGRAAPLYYGRRADAWTPGGQWDINKPPSPLFVYAVPIMSSPDP